MSMTKEIAFAGVELEMGLSYSITEAFEQSYESSKNISQKCEYNPDGTKFTTGCMW